MDVEVASLAIVNTAAMKCGAQASFSVMLFFFLEKLSFLNVVTDFKDTDVLQLCWDSNVLFPSVFTLLQAEHKEESTHVFVFRLLAS